MEKINNFSKFCLALSAALASAFSGVLQEQLAKSLGNGMAWGFTCLSLLVFLLLLQYLIENLINQSQRLRKLLLGKSFVEGYWYDTSKDGDQIFAHAIVYIYYEDNSLKISGLTRQNAKQQFSSWDSTFVSFNVHNLSYTFQALTGDTANPIEVGYGELKFNHGNQSPHFYTVYYFDTHNKKIVTLDGVKVDQKAGEFAKQDGRHEFLNKAIDEATQKVDPGVDSSLPSNHRHPHPSTPMNPPI